MTAKDIMIATGSVPFVPPGIPIDGKTVRFCPMFRPILLQKMARYGACVAAHEDKVECRAEQEDVSGSYL